MEREITVIIYKGNDNVTSKTFKDDELTSGAELAAMWLKKQDGDPLDG